MTPGVIFGRTPCERGHLLKSKQTGKPLTADRSAHRIFHSLDGRSKGTVTALPAVAIPRERLSSNPRAAREKARHDARHQATHRAVRNQTFFADNPDRRQRAFALLSGNRRPARHHRRREPDAVRPYRVWGYPIVPALFVLASSILLYYTFTDNLLNSALGCLVILAGVPVFYYFRRRHAV